MKGVRRVEDVVGEVERKINVCCKTQTFRAEAKDVPL